MIFQSELYPSVLLKKINELKYSESFCDIKFEVDNKVYAAHKLVLSASSPYFLAMFQSNMLEHNKDVVSLKDVPSTSFKTILNFIYTSKLEITDENVLELLSSANMLQITEVQEHCCDYLKKNLVPLNCIGIYQYADLFNCTELKDFCLAYIQDHFLEVIKGDEFFDISKESLKIIIASEDLNIENEFQVFTAVMEWILKEPCKRRKCVYYLMNDIRTLLLPTRMVNEFISDCSDLGLSVVLRNIFKDVELNHHLLGLESKLNNHKKQITPRLKARKNILVIGGYCQNAGQRWGESKSTSLVEKLSIHNTTWSFVAPMNHARNGHCSCILERKVYVIGGENESMIMDSVEMYDYDSNIWTEIASMPHPRSQHCCVVSFGTIFIFGGWIGPEITSKIDTFNPYTKSWSQIGDLNHRKYGMGICCVDGLIYLIGGKNELGLDSNSLICYNSITNKIIKLKPLKYSVSFPGIAVINDYIYVIGGSSDNRCLKNLSRYCIKTNEWKDLPSMFFEKSNIAVVSINHEIYSIGGRVGHSNNISVPSTLRSVDVYDIHQESWSIQKIPPMITSRCEGTAIVF